MQLRNPDFCTLACPNDGATACGKKAKESHPANAQTPAPAIGRVTHPACHRSRPVIPSRTVEMTEPNEMQNSLSRFPKHHLKKKLNAFYYTVDVVQTVFRIFQVKIPVRLK